ncbi:MAG: hypothetical protein JJE15_11785 [Desulfobacteraceae bacterium]|nr:hypothetical protein [Desulfobacteraceae bacterium]
MRRTLAVVLLILVAVFVALGACGKKGPPFLSERITPVKVEKPSNLCSKRAGNTPEYPGFCADKSI